MGTYLILTTNGNMIYSPSVVNLVPEYSGGAWILTDETVAIKASSVQITKSVITDTNTGDTNTGDTDTSDTNYSFGTYETISYRIEADVPDYPEGSVLTNYYISDKMSEGLTLDQGSIKVTGKKENLTVDLTESNTGNDYYTIYFNEERPSDSDETVDFLIDFNYENISAYDEIIVEYTATLNTNANIGEDGNTNNAYLDYSNDPRSNQETPLSGAEFELQDEDGTAYKFVEVNGKYWLVAEDVEGTTTTTTLKVDGNGKLYINGLAEGTYYLKETKAPANYTKATTREVITISGEDLGTDGIYKLKFLNGTFFSLPTTGGIGIVIFIASGIVLIGLGIALFVFATKKRKTNK